MAVVGYVQEIKDAVSTNFPFHKYYDTYLGWNRTVEGNVKTDYQRVGNAQNEKVGNDAKSRLVLCER